LNSKIDLGTAYVLGHRYADADRLLRETLPTAHRVLGPEDSQTLWAENSLAAAYAGDHRYADAERVLRETLTTARRVLGETNELTAELIYNLACLAALQGHRAEALTTLRQALDHGYRRADEMPNDEDLKSLHGDPRFDAILADLKKLDAAK
jgi:hypothetical protein